MLLYTFSPITNINFALLHTWLNQDFVSEKWDGAQSMEEVTTEYNKKIQSEKEFAYLVWYQKKPFAYIQAYNAYKSGDGWWEDMTKGTWGIDTYIGEREFLGKGHGSAYIKQFVEKIFAEKGALQIIADPAPNNRRAIRAYEKAGFKRIKEVITPDGKALLMEIKSDER